MGKISWGMGNCGGGNPRPMELYHEIKKKKTSEKNQIRTNKNNKNE